MRPDSPSRTRTLPRSRIGLPGEPGRCFCNYLPFLSKLFVLAAQLAQLLALGRCKPDAAAAVIKIGLSDPIANRLPGGLELLGQLFRPDYGQSERTRSSGSGRQQNLAGVSGAP